MQTTMRKNKKEWVAATGLLLFIGLLGLLVPSAAPLGKGGPIVAGDVAWMLTATALVLLMTPGLSFFTAGWSSAKMSSQP